MSVTLYFDPSCPWTWVTSRWLRTVASAEGFDIQWRSFSLPYARGDQGDMNREQRVARDAIVAAHRVIEVLWRRRDNDAVGRFYDDLGQRWHEQRADRDVAAVVSAADEAGVSDAASAIDAAELDEGVAASTEEAIALAGPDVGSPVLELADGRSLFGPILHAVPDLDHSRHVWQAVQLLADVSEYHELKRGRLQPPSAA